MALYLKTKYKSVLKRQIKSDVEHVKNKSKSLNNPLIIGGSGIFRKELVMLIEPKEITIKYEEEEYKFNISKLPATVGREIITQYPVANIPKIGEYKVSEEIMLKLLSYTERIYPDKEQPQPLTNKTLIDNHIPNWEVLCRLEFEMINYNCSFFKNGKGLDSLMKLIALAQPKIIETLTGLSEQLSQAKKQH